MFDWLNNSQGVILILRLGLWAPDKCFKSTWQKKYSLREHPAYHVLSHRLSGAISAKSKRSPPVDIQWVPRIVHSQKCSLPIMLMTVLPTLSWCGGEGDAGKWRPGDQLILSQFCMQSVVYSQVLLSFMLFMTKQNGKYCFFINLKWLCHYLLCEWILWSLRVGFYCIFT